MEFPIMGSLASKGITACIIEQGLLIATMASTRYVGSDSIHAQHPRGQTLPDQGVTVKCRRLVPEEEYFFNFRNRVANWLPLWMPVGGNYFI